MLRNQLNQGEKSETENYETLIKQIEEDTNT